MVDNFGQSQGIASELSHFSLKDFTALFNRLLDEMFEEMDTDNSGGVSKKEFYRNLRSSMGWQAKIIKKHINKTFDNAIKAGDLDGDQNLDKQEIKLLLRKIALGEIKTSDIISLPPLMK